MDSLETRKGSPKESPVVSKANFNKKKWRDRKYSIKAKVENWDNIKRQQALRQFNKQLKKSGNPVPFNPNAKLNKNVSSSSFKQAEQYYQHIKQEKEEKRKTMERIKKEKMEAIKAYKEKKAMRYRKLSQKTKKGQPLMKGRIELLLEKIEKEYSSQNNK